MKNPILQAGSNLYLKVTNFFSASGITASELNGIPLGTVGGTATGELAVKVAIVAGGAGSVTATPPVGTRVSSTAYESSHVIRAATGTLTALIGYNSGPAQFVQLFNSATVPADTAIPVITFLVPAATNFSVDVPLTGIPFATGISVSNSSTGPTKTAGANDCFFTGVYF